jgi:hypothetical protein
MRPLARSGTTPSATDTDPASAVYIGHAWFLEAGELPVWDNPKMGGDYPFILTSGHNRWVFTLNIAQRTMLQTHRGLPICPV